jgi:hypothetical protein
MKSSAAAPVAPPPPPNAPTQAKARDDVLAAGNTSQPRGRNSLINTSRTGLKKKNNKTSLLGGQ